MANCFSSVCPLLIFFGPLPYGCGTRCPSEVDDIWLIRWPATKSGSEAVTECSGIDSIGKPINLLICTTLFIQICKVH